MLYLLASQCDGCWMSQSLHCRLDSMDISLPAEFEQFISEQVSRGYYQSPNEVICEGLRLMENRARAYGGRFESLKQEILHGLDSLQQADPVEGSAALQEIRKQFQLNRDRS